MHMENSAVGYGYGYGYGGTKYAYRAASGTAALVRAPYLRRAIIMLREANPLK